MSQIGPPERRRATDTPGGGVDQWIGKGFSGLVGLAATILVIFFGWIASNLNDISVNTASLQSDSTNTKALVSSMVDQMTGLKSTLDDLRIRSESWATKDALSSAKDGMRSDLSKVQDSLISIELRVTRMEERVGGKISWPAMRTEQND